MTTATEDRPEPEYSRPYVAALDIVVTLLLRRLALESGDPIAELDAFKQRALRDAWGGQLEFGVPQAEIAERIEAIVSNAETRLNWTPPG